MKLFSNTISTLENSLNYSSTKQKVIAENIANADTPNFKSKNASFKSTMEAAMDQTLQARKTNSKHLNFKGITMSNIAITTDRTTSYHNNGNNVDLDKEMSDLAANQIYYNALIDRISGKFKSLQSVIRGGK